MTTRSRHRRSNPFPDRPTPRRWQSVSTLLFLPLSLGLFACGESTETFRGARASYTVEDSRHEYRDEHTQFVQSSHGREQYTLQLGADRFTLGLPTLEERTWEDRTEVTLKHRTRRSPGSSEEYEVYDCRSDNFRIEVHRDQELLWGRFSGELCAEDSPDSTVTLSDGSFTAEFVE